MTLPTRSRERRYAANPFLDEIIRSSIVGFSAAIVFVALILIVDLAHIRELAFHSEVGLMAVGLLFFFSSLTFSSAQMGMRVFFALDEDERR